LHVFTCLARFFYYLSGKRIKRHCYGDLASAYFVTNLFVILLFGNKQGCVKKRPSLFILYFRSNLLCSPIDQRQKKSKRFLS